MNKVKASDVERRILACKTCHTSLETCPDCGVRKSHASPMRKMFCTKCDKELVEVGKHEQPGEMMGFEGVYKTPIQGCPECGITWCYATHEQMKEVYVDSF